MSNDRGVGFARHYCVSLARELGLKTMFMMDDNILRFHSLKHSSGGDATSDEGKAGHGFSFSAAPISEWLWSSQVIVDDALASRSIKSKSLRTYLDTSRRDSGYAFSVMGSRFLYGAENMSPSPADPSFSVNYCFGVGKCLILHHQGTISTHIDSIVWCVNV